MPRSEIVGLYGNSQVALMVKNLSSSTGDVRDMVGLGDLLEEATATYSSILA